MTEQDKPEILKEGSSKVEEQEHLESKGKGKAMDPATEDTTMDDDDESSDEDVGGDEEEEAVADVDEEEDMAEIDEENIIRDGRRTRGKNIDFAKAAENAGDELEEDEEDDGDFEAEVDDADAMKE